MGTLTVRENLRFSAALRLPSSVPQSEKEARVNHLIKELGLTKVADSKVNIHTRPNYSSNPVLGLKLQDIRWESGQIDWSLWGVLLRWAHRWPGESLEERGRGQTSVWSWLLIPQFSFWMNRPQDWTPALLTRSCCCWKGSKEPSLPFLRFHLGLSWSLIMESAVSLTQNDTCIQCSALPKKQFNTRNTFFQSVNYMYMCVTLLHY